MTSAAKKGSKILHVVSQAGFNVGDTIHIGDPSSAFTLSETNTIASFGSIHLATPLERNWSPGTPVTAEP